MLTSIFRAIGRLAAAIERTAEIFETTNTALEHRFVVVDDGDRPRLTAESNGRRQKVGV